MSSQLPPFTPRLTQVALTFLTLLAQKAFLLEGVNMTGYISPFGNISQRKISIRGSKS